MIINNILNKIPIYLVSDGELQLCIRDGSNAWLYDGHGRLSANGSDKSVIN